MLLVSFSLQAQRTFVKHYGTSESEFGTALSLTDSSGILLCQTVQTSPPSNFSYLGLVKTDANGHMEWNKVYSAHDITIAKSILKWKDGFIILATTWDFGSTQYKVVLMRINSDGDFLWMKEYSSSNADLASGLSIHNDQFYVTATADYNIGAVYTKLLWFKTDSSGVVLNSKLYSAPLMFSSMTSMVNDSGKTGAVCESNSFGIGNPVAKNLVALQLDSIGNIEWSNSIGTRYDDEASDISVDGSKWLITGRSVFLNFNYDLSLFRVDSFGNLSSYGFYDAGTTEGEAGRSIITGDNHSCIIAGDAGTINERNMNLAKFDQNDNVIWANEDTVSPHFTNYPYDLVALQNDSGYLFTGDLRPPSDLRNAALFRTDFYGEAGCFTQPISFTKRADTVEVIPVSLTDVPFTLTENTITEQLINIVVLENKICQPLVADFSYTMDTICPDVCFDFKDESIGATSWHWDFPLVPTSFNSQGPHHICTDTSGTFAIKLWVTDGITADSITKTITLDHICDTIFIPNAVTPNGDFQNDQFAPKNLPDNFHLTIYNRWGNQLFETTDENKMWPEKPGTNEVNDGVYYYVLDILPPAVTRSYHGYFSIFNGTK